MDKLQEALSVNEINQLRGNYNKLVEQCKELQETVKIKNRIINIMAQEYEPNEPDNYIEMVEKRVNQ